MNPASAQIQRNYIILTLLNTLAASFIWGINTLFLLDAGLSNVEAFAANAFFTVGMVLFEVPTGVIADTLGRRASYMLGTTTLASSTLLYLLLWQISAPFWAWAAVSMLLGLGFTFFSGAVEAWLVDALRFTGYKGQLDSVFAKGQVATGVAMLTGSVAGGIVAQATNLGVPYILRALTLLASFVLAFLLMKDLGFQPEGRHEPLKQMKKIFVTSTRYGLRNRPIRWLMLSAPFLGGVGIYVFYALQPYLLELYGDKQAYAVAGLAAAVVAGSQIVGGLSVSYVRRLFRKRTSLLITAVGISALLLFLIGSIANFWVVLLLMIGWALLSAASLPVRQAYLNDVIEAKERASILSFDSLMNSAGGIFIQPTLGKAADVWSYGTSYVIASFVQLGAIPFLVLAKKERIPADDILKTQSEKVPVNKEVVPTTPPEH